MRFNALDFIQSFAVALPAFAMSLVAIAVIFHRLKQRIGKPKRLRRSRRFASAIVSVAMGLTFLPFAAIYRPNLIEVAKGQIRQQEDVDEDDNSDPETPHKYLLGQLRRIRRGEKVDTIFLRRE